MASNKKLKGLFLNTPKANCSIHESGRMCFDALKLSNHYSIDYKEVTENDREINLSYDFYVFNYHAGTMGWLDTTAVKSLPGFTATIVLEVLPNNPFVLCPANDFDAYLVLDPTIASINAKVYAFPRPLEISKQPLQYVKKTIPQIGTFGFATPGKGFDKVIDAVNKEFDEAVVKINIPEGDYVPKSHYEELVGYLKNYPAKPGVKVEITNDFLDKEQLIDWCAQNTLNAFLYNRNMAGLSATTDQAITSGRPLIVSANDTFRHIHKYIKPYPYQSLKEAIANTPQKVAQIQKDWAPINFALKFETMLTDFNVKVNETNAGVVNYKLKSANDSKTRKYNVSKSDFIPPIAGKIWRKIFPPKQTQEPSRILEPLVHYSIQSYSQFNEDLVIDLLLGQKDDGFYVDVGANDPTFNSNTKRFYRRGWHGLNIEPGLKAFNKLSTERTRDINLNLAVSNEKGEDTFYYLSDDHTLSTLDIKDAERMSKALGLTISSGKIQTDSLENILDTYLQGNEIDFMSIDAEGHDLTVLKSNNWHKYRPALVMVESNNEFNNIRAFMDSNDYLHVFSNFYNCLFADKLTSNAALLKNLKWD